MDKFLSMLIDSQVPLFSNLWKTDDKLWVKRRKDDWKELGRTLFKECSPAELSTNRRYFLTGVKKGYIGQTERLLLTPFESTEDVRELVFNAKYKIFVQSDIERILANYFGDTCQASSAGFYKDHAKLIAKTFYLDRYSEIMWEDLSGGLLNVAPEPTAFVMNYISNIVHYFNNKFYYTGNIECFDYFCSCLPEAKKATMRSRLDKSGLLNTMLELAHKISEDPEESDREKIGIAACILEMKDHIREEWEKNSHVGDIQ